MNSNTKGYLAMIIAILGWGASSPFIELGLKSGIDPIQFLTFRFLIASSILTPYVIIKRMNILRYFKIPLVWVIGLSESFGLVFQYLGQQQQIAAGLASLLSLMFIVLVPLLSPIILNESLKNQHVYAISVALVGVIIIASDGNILGVISGNISFLGLVFLLLAALNYAFYIIFTSQLRKTDLSVDTFGLYYVVLIIISISSSLYSIIVGNFQSKPSGNFFSWLILLVLFSTLIAFLAYFEAMKTISANLASILLLLQVVVAFIFDLILIGNHYSIYSIIGSIIILIGLFIAILANATKSSQKTEYSYRKNAISSRL